MINLDNLKTLAEAATPGEWTFEVNKFGSAIAVDGSCIATAHGIHLSRNLLLCMVSCIGTYLGTLGISLCSVVWYGINYSLWVGCINEYLCS